MMLMIRHWLSLMGITGNMVSRSMMSSVLFSLICLCRCTKSFLLSSKSLLFWIQNSKEWLGDLIASLRIWRCPALNEFRDLTGSEVTYFERWSPYRPCFFCSKLYIALFKCLSLASLCSVNAFTFLFSGQVRIKSEN